MVMTSVPSPPGCTVRLRDSDVSEKSGRGATLKVAVTDWPAFMATLQAPVPEQAPPQPEKVDPEAGEAARVTVVPLTKVDEQELPQSIPAGLLVTVPTPFPSRATETVKCTRVVELFRKTLTLNPRHINHRGLKGAVAVA